MGGGGASLRSDGAPRFARTEHLASLGQAELRKWLSSVGACVFLCSVNPWRGAAIEGSRAGTYQVAYHVEGSSGDGLLRFNFEMLRFNFEMLRFKQALISTRGAPVGRLARLWEPNSLIQWRPRLDAT